MAKITGLNPLAGTSKKTGKAFNAVMISFLAGYRQTDSEAVGQKANEVFVDRSLFDVAAKGRLMKDLVGHDITLVYNSSGYLDDVSIA